MLSSVNQKWKTVWGTNRRDTKYSLPKKKMDLCIIVNWMKLFMYYIHMYKLCMSKWNLYFYSIFKITTLILHCTKPYKITKKRRSISIKYFCGIYLRICYSITYTLRCIYLTSRYEHSNSSINISFIGYRYRNNTVIAYIALKGHLEISGNS